MAIFCLFLLVLFIPPVESLYTLKILSNSSHPFARCLDGTQGAYYFRPSPSGTKNVKIFFEGGGWCTSDGDCYARSLTALGSNAKLPPTSQEPSGYCGSGFLSDDPKVNPTTYDWNAIYVPYCDGSVRDYLHFLFHRIG